MTVRTVATRELASLLSVLAHAHRVRIVEELRQGEHDVNFLADALAVSHSRVSQHLALLRSHRLVRERRDGRHVFYSLANPELARWLVAGLNFVEAELTRNDEIRDAVHRARDLWTGDAPDPVSAPTPHPET